MTVRPVSLNQALAAFSDVYSPRIAGRVNDYDIRLAHTRGEHVWHNFGLKVEHKVAAWLGAADQRTAFGGTINWVRGVADHS